MNRTGGQKFDVVCTVYLTHNRYIINIWGKNKGRKKEEEKKQVTIFHNVDWWVQGLWLHFICLVGAVCVETRHYILNCLLSNAALQYLPAVTSGRTWIREEHGVSIQIVFCLTTSEVDLFWEGRRAQGCLVLRLKSFLLHSDWPSKRGRPLSLSHSEVQEFEMVSHFFKLSTS